MENEYTRACIDIATIMDQASGLAAPIPGIQHAFMMMSRNIQILAQEEKKRLFWKMVGGEGPMSIIHAVCNKKTKEDYSNNFFVDGCNHDFTIPEAMKLVGWLNYLKANSELISGVLQDYDRPNRKVSNRWSSTSFISDLVVVSYDYSQKTVFEISHPDCKIGKVSYSNTLENVSDLCVNTLLNSTPSDFLNRDLVFTKCLEHNQLYAGQAYDDLLKDNKEEPVWTELLKATNFASGQLEVAIEDFTVHPTDKKPKPLNLDFYRDESGRLKYVAFGHGAGLLEQTEGLWSELPFVIRRLILRLDITGLGEYATGYEIRDNDIFPVAVVVSEDQPLLHQP